MDDCLLAGLTPTSDIVDNYVCFKPTYYIRLHGRNVPEDGRMYTSENISPDGCTTNDSVLP
jgi:hypothetical protein